MADGEWTPALRKTHYPLPITRSGLLHPLERSAHVIVAAPQELQAAEKPRSSPDRGFVDAALFPGVGRQQEVRFLRLSGAVRHDDRPHALEVELPRRSLRDDALFALLDDRAQLHGLRLLAQDENLGELAATRLRVHGADQAQPALVTALDHYADQAADPRPGSRRDHGAELIAA